MTTITISIDRSKLPAHTDEQFEEWVKYNVRHCGGILLINPLSDVDFEAEVKEIK